MQTVADLPAAGATSRPRRSHKALAALAALLALWLGLTAPGESPVAPAPAAQQAPTANVGPQVGQDTAQLVVPDDGRPGRGRR